MTPDVAAHPLTIVRVDEQDDAGVRSAHRVLKQTIGADAVEDLDSFTDTVSTSTDGAVVPVLLVGRLDVRLAGAMAGVYLKKLNTGMVLYAGVLPRYRKRGVYTELRCALVTALETTAGGTKLDYLLTELEREHHLFDRYVERLNAFVAPIEYQQPAVQGLRGRRLSLVIQPMTKRTLPSNEDLVNIVREIYDSVYRLPNVPQSNEFLRVVKSMYSTV